MIHSRDQLLHLIPEFTALPAETEWLEFKIDNTDPKMIGERISALANSARIVGRDFGYLIWGIEDEVHKIVGTTFDPETARKGNESLQSWLAHMINPEVHFEFETVQVHKIRVVVLTIEPASFEPVKFSGTAYVRVGPTTQQLSKYPDRERRLWRALTRRMGICEERGSGWDKVAFEVEFHQLPAPEVVTTADTTRVTLLSPRPLTDMSPEDKARAVYLHACLNQVSRRSTTNSSVRQRFGIDEQNKATASRLLKDAVKRGLIAPYDKDTAPRFMRYVPFWAAPVGTASTSS
jgi:predicted HTH transcriptional regulator